MGQHFPFSHFLSKNTNLESNNSNLQGLLKAQTSHQPSENTLQLFSETNNVKDNDALKNSMVAQLKLGLGEQKYKMFFDGHIQFSLKENSTLEICVAHEWQRELAETQFRDAFNQAVSNTHSELSWEVVCKSTEASVKPERESLESPLSAFLNPNEGQDVFQSLKNQKASEARFTLDVESKEAAPENKNVTSFQPEKIIKETKNGHTTIHYGQTIDAQKTLDNFVVGPSNNLAFATAHAVAASPGKKGKYPCLYIYSDSGLGKTHLLHAVANAIKDKYPEKSICLISSREFLKELIDAFKDKKLDQFQKKYCENIDVLMIDDIHELKNKAQTQNEFFHIFNELHARGKQLIFTSDKDPQEIDGIEDRIITRLQWGLVVDIQKPDLETRIAILQKKAFELDLFLPDDVISMIAVSVKSSIRELEGCLVRLMAMADVMNIEIDVEMAKDILKLAPEKETKKLTIDLITKSAANYFRVEVVDMKSKSRSQALVKARHIAWYLCKKILGATYKEIAAYYGNRDHSSVIHGVQKITDKIKNDSNLSKDVIYLENNL